MTIPSGRGRNGDLSITIILLKSESTLHLSRSISPSHQSRQQADSVPQIPGRSQKGSHFPLFSAIVRVSKTPILAIGELEMITVEDREAIRRAYYLNRKSKRQIAREQGHSRKTIDKAVENLPPQPYRLTKPKAAPVFGPFQPRAHELLTHNNHLPTNHHYTSPNTFQVLQGGGYQSSESRV